MSANTKIEWADHTFNPWVGCTKVSPACDHCYAERWAKRAGKAAGVVWGGERRRTSEANWHLPARWNKKAKAEGRRYRVFCASLADVFDNQVPVQWRISLMRLIMETPNLDWLLLTKRIGNAAEMLETAFRGHTAQREGWRDNVPQNVWIGATICNQAEAERDIPKLLATPAAVRFLSIEPMLGPIDLERACDIAEADVCAGSWAEMADPQRCALALRHGSVRLLDWVICGGESGPGARPMHPDWARSLRDQCAAAGVPFLMKQWGEWHTAAVHTGSGDAVFRQFPDFQTWVNKARTWVNGGICLDRHGCEMKNGGDMRRASEAGDFPVTIMHKVGKKAAGRTLDGVEHNGFPIGGAA